MTRWVSFAAGLFVLSLAVPAGATEYYVDANAGDDGNDGLAESPQGGNHGPWRSLARVAEATLVAGDVVYFARGGHWRGQVTINASGDANAPITFTAYGTGDRPIINAAQPITGWTVHSGNIYRADVPFEVRQVFINGAHALLAHHPNDSYLTVDESLSDTTFVDGDHGLIAAQISGADVHILARVWATEVHYVASYSDTDNVFTLGGQVTWSPRPGNNYYLTNKLWMLDAPGEWVYENGTLYVWMFDGSDPSGHTVEATEHWYGFYANGRSNFVVSGFEIRHAGHSGVGLVNCDEFDIVDNTLHDIGTMLYYDPWEQAGSGITVLSGGGTDLNGAVRNNTIENVIHRGIYAGYGLDRLVISGNVLAGAGMIGSADFMLFTGKGIDARSPADIEGNELSSTSSVGMMFAKQATVVRRNFVERACLEYDDCGAIYTSGPDNQDSIIEENIVLATSDGDLDRPNSGIYLDEEADDNAVLHNTVAHGGRYCLQVHVSRNETIQNNHLFACRGAIVMQEDNNAAGPDYMVGMLVEYNDLVIPTDQILVRIANWTGSAHIDFGDWDHNRYSNTKPDELIYEVGSGVVNTYYSLDQWQTTRNHDVNGSFVSQSGRRPIIVINHSYEEQSFETQGESYWDMNGDQVVDSVRILPFRSVILFAEPGNDRCGETNVCVIHGDETGPDAGLGDGGLDADGSRDAGTDLPDGSSPEPSSGPDSGCNCRTVHAHPTFGQTGWPPACLFLSLVLAVLGLRRRSARRI